MRTTYLNYRIIFFIWKIKYPKKTKGYHVIKVTHRLGGQCEFQSGWHWEEGTMGRESHLDRMMEVELSCGGYNEAQTHKKVGVFTVKTL